MSKERPMTAADLAARLRGDTQYQEREAAKDQKREEQQRAFDQSFRPYLTQLHSLGLFGNSLQEIVKSNSPLPDDAVNVLLSALGSISEPRLQESVIRALGAAEHPFDGRPLVLCFDSTNDVALQWAIVNTIALTHPHSIEEWLRGLRKSSYWNGTLHKLEFEP